MDKNNLASKIIEADKKYLNMKYLIIIGLIIGLGLFILNLKFPFIDNFIKNNFYEILVPVIILIQAIIVFYCIFVFIKGGIRKAVRKDIEKLGREKVLYATKQLSLLSFLVPGSGQLLLGYEKRGILIFSIFLILESIILIFLDNLLSLNYFLLFIALITAVLWIWNIIDAKKLANQFNLSKQT